MPIELKVPMDGANIFNALAIGFGIEVLSGRVDSLASTSSYQNLLALFSLWHKDFNPKTWSNFKSWLSYYNDTRDLQLVLGPVLFQFYRRCKPFNQGADVNRLGIDDLKSLSESLCLNLSQDSQLQSAPSRIKVDICLIKKERVWHVYCSKADYSLVSQGAAIILHSSHNAYQGLKRISAPTRVENTEYAKKVILHDTPFGWKQNHSNSSHAKSKQSSAKKDNSMTFKDGEFNKLGEHISQSTRAYIQYSESILISIFHHHGESGRVRALNFSIDFYKCKNIAEGRDFILRFLSNPDNGNTNPHSFRTMLLMQLFDNEKEKPQSLAFLAQYFDVYLKKLREAYFMPCSYEGNMQKFI
jgi:hypothetical protein